MLTLQAQTFVNKIKEADPTKRKKIIIIHNFVELKTVESVKNQIEIDIKRSFSVTTLEKQIYGAGKCQIYLEMSEDVANQNPVEHLIYASEGSPAGNEYNKHTLDYLQQMVASLQCYGTVNVFQKFCDYINTNIPHYVSLPGIENINFKFQSTQPGVCAIRPEQ